MENGAMENMNAEVVTDITPAAAPVRNANGVEQDVRSVLNMGNVMITMPVADASGSMIDTMSVPPHGVVRIPPGHFVTSRTLEVFDKIIPHE